MGTHKNVLNIFGACVGGECILWFFKGKKKKSSKKLVFSLNRSKTGLSILGSIFENRTSLRPPWQTLLTLKVKGFIDKVFTHHTVLKKNERNYLIKCILLLEFFFFGIPAGLKFSMAEVPPEAVRPTKFSRKPWIHNLTRCLYRNLHCSKRPGVYN